MASNSIAKDHHNLRRNLKLNGKYISNDGGDEGIAVSDAGLVTVSGDLDIASNMTIADNEIDISSGNLTLDVASDIILDHGAGDEITFQENGSTYAQLYENSGAYLKLYEGAGGTDNFQVACLTNGASSIGTTDSAGNEADLTLDIDGHIQIYSYGHTHTLAESVGEAITFTPGSKVLIDKDRSETTAAFTKALHIDLDRTGDVSSGTDVATGIDIDVDHTGASGGTISSVGVNIDVTGDSGGTSIGYGVLMDLDGADVCYGLHLDVAAGTASTSNGIYLDNTNGGTDFKNISSANTNDYFTINTIANGVTTLTTVDSDDVLANFNIVAGGAIDIASTGDFEVDASGSVTLDAGSGQIILKSGGSTYTPTAVSHAVTKAYADANIYHFIRVGWYQSADTKAFLFIAGAETQRDSTVITSAGENFCFLCPYDGSFEKVIVRSESVCGSSIFGLHRTALALEIPSTTAVQSVTVNMAVDDTSYEFDFASAGTNTFNKGDIIAFSFDPTNIPYDIHCIIVLKLDVTT